MIRKARGSGLSKTDLEYLEDIRQGGNARAEAISELYRRYALRFASFFRRRGLSRSDVDDVVQNTFIQVIRHCGTFRGDCDIQIWLWKVARNSLMTFFRQRAKSEPRVELDEELLEQLGVHDADRGLEDCVKQAMSRFRQDHDEHAQVIELAAIEGWTTEELSILLGRTLGATREYLSQCRKRFAPYMESCREYLS